MWRSNFLYCFRRENKPFQLRTGDYPSITLLQARERRQQLRTWITEGYDLRRQVVSERMQNVEALTVEAADEYWESDYAKPKGLIKTHKNRQSFENM
ncbi:Arm DNA-binding domain-containing protein [Erwiniaceae bacterium CAU 1747]